MVRITCGAGLETCVWNESIPTAYRDAWQLLPQSSDCRGGAFATVVVNERYVDPAICLRDQLRRVGSVCPALAIWDDRVDAVTGLSGPSYQRLARAYGEMSLLPLTQLLKRAGRDAPTNISEYARGGGLPPPLHGQQAGRDLGQSRRPTATVPNRGTGRRLYQPGTPNQEQWNALFQKLFVWAIDPARHPRVALLDADLLLRHNLDPLLAHEFTGPVAGVPCTDDMTYFNTGVLVLQPSLHTLHRLLQTKPGKKCENKITDQSVINLYFGGGRRTEKWDRLRFPYNVPHRLHFGAPASFWTHAAAAAIHFTGEPKPWDAPSTLSRVFWGARAMAPLNEYRLVCGLGPLAV